MPITENTVARAKKEVRAEVGGMTNVTAGEPVTGHNPAIKIRKSGDLKTIYTKLDSGKILVQTITGTDGNIDISKQWIDDTGIDWDSL